MLRPLFYYLTDKNTREFYTLKDKYIKYERYTSVKNVRFLNYQIDIIDNLSFIYQFREIFVNEIYKFKTQRSKPVIYDCGANIGLGILFFKKVYPEARIIAFEADPLISEVLTSNLIKNGVRDVEIVKKAVWINNSKIPFGCEWADGGSIYRSTNLIEVETIRLRDFLEREDIVDFLKIDIEGAEVAVINDCNDVLNRVNNLFIEYHSFFNKPQELSSILTILENLGFRYYIENVSFTKYPFLNHDVEKEMDLQVNIFARRRF